MIRHLFLCVIIAGVICAAAGCQDSEGTGSPNGQVQERIKETDPPELFQQDRPSGQSQELTADAAANDELNLYAQSAVLLDGTTGRVLYGKNETVVRPMASTTKIMTCILALELAGADDTVTASKLAASQPKVHLGVREGETFKLGDLLYSLMLESHNDTAVMIAEHVGGSVEGFARLMNQKARDIGCSDSYFITPNGLDASEQVGKETVDHSTTAVDLGRIMNYCIGQSPQKEEFLKITETQDYYFSDLKGKRSFSCTNHNALLSMMDGLISGKTGFTGGAGYSYVGTLKDGDRVFTIALLGCGWPPHKTYKWSDARKLFAYGKDNYQFCNVYEEKKIPDVMVMGGIPASGDLSEQVKISCEIQTGTEGKELNLLMSREEKVTISCQMPKELEAPVMRGQSIGSITYKLGGETIKVYPVCAAEDIPKLDFSWCLKKVRDLVFGMPGIPGLPFP